MKYLIKTLGCKVNQVDSIRLAEALERAGWSRAGRGEVAQVCIINTCTVTARTDTQCRQEIRRALRENPGARVVVTGCYAEVAPEEVGAIPGVERVLGNREKERAAEILAGPALRRGAEPGASLGTGGTPLIQGAGGRSRAFVRVQDGCDATCAYCIVPRARGASRSQDPDRVVREVRGLVDKGFAEIVLSGIHLGAYGLDRGRGPALPALLRRLIRIPGRFRIRLSSVEPLEANAELIDLVTGEEKICSHLHIPLQSADPEILRRMGRPYTPDHFARIVLRIRDRNPEAAVGTDLIAGLPGETDTSFERSCDWIASLPLTHFHVFPYSPRAGTPAAVMEGQVPAKVRKERAARLRELCAGMRAGFLEAMAGRVHEVVALGDSGPGGVRVLTDNYLEGLLAPAPARAAGLFFVKSSHVSADRLLVQEV